MKPEIENYGFADDSEMIAQSQTELKAGTTHIELWCKENQIELNASQCKLLNRKGLLSASLKKLTWRKPQYSETHGSTPQISAGQKFVKSGSKK